MANSYKILLLGVCIFAILHLQLVDAKPSNRKRRFVDDYDSDEGLEDIDSNELSEREERKVEATYPPFPEEADWAGDWFLPTSESSYNPYKEEIAAEQPEFHKKIVPWFKKTWGHTKGFFKKHYENAANALG